MTEPTLPQQLREDAQRLRLAVQQVRPISDPHLLAVAARIMQAADALETADAPTAVSTLLPDGDRA